MSSIEWKIINFINDFISSNSNYIVNNNWIYNFEDVLYIFEKKYPDINLSNQQKYNMKKNYKEVLEWSIKTAHPRITKKDLTDLFESLKI